MLKNNKIPKLLNDLHAQQIYNKLGLSAIRLIKKRTREGKDMHGSEFIQYSAGYIKKKDKAGFADPHKVNLTFSKVGGMLSSIDHKVNASLTSVLVFFDDREKERIAKYHQIEGAGKGRVIREFFDIVEQSEIDQLVDIGAKEVSKIIKRL